MWWRQTARMLSVTERDLLRFDSTFDLLTRLGFTEDQAHERMVAPGGARMVAFAQIGGRSVAEFVRWGMENGLLLPYLAETSQQLPSAPRVGGVLQ